MRAILTIFLAFILAWPALADEEELKVYSGAIAKDIYAGGATVDVDADVTGDVFAGGSSIAIAGSVTEDVFAAGGRASVRAKVAGDVVTAAGTATVSGNVGDNLIVAGGTITIDGAVGGKAIAAGGQVEIGRSAVVTGNAIIAGGQVVIHGKLMKNLRVVGGRVVILGEVAGDIDARTESLTIGPQAKVGGRIVHRGPERPEISASATVGGPVEHHPQAGLKAAKPALAVWAASLTVVPYLFCLAVGLGVLFLAPGYARRLAERVAGQPLATFGLGVLLAFGVPVALLALMVTIIGIPFALLGFAVYGVMVMVGLPLGAFALTRRFAERGGRTPSRTKEAVIFALGLLALFIIALIPFLGQLGLWVVWSLGVGASVLALKTAAAT